MVSNSDTRDDGGEYIAMQVRAFDSSPWGQSTEVILDARRTIK